MKARRSLIPAFAALLALASCGGTEYPDGSALILPERSGHGSLLVNSGEPMAYFLHLPALYADKGARDKRYPLIVSLHGMGEASDKISGAVFTTSCVSALQRAASKVGVDAATLDAIMSSLDPELSGGLVMVPQNKTRSGWNIADLDAVMTRVMEKYRVDPARIYMTGVSMGGFGAWDYAAAHPDRLAALIPVCGRHERGGTAERLGGTAVWAFHAIDDAAVVFTRAYMGVLDMLTADPADDLADALPRILSSHLTASGTERYEGWRNGLLSPSGRYTVTLYRSGGHQIWNTAYSTEGLWDWVYAQKRP